jgi:Flp pilus assembly protein TadB
VAEAAGRSAKRVAWRRRRRRWRVAVRSALPWSPGQRWSRRTRTQRAAVAGILLGVFVITWLMTPVWSVRVAVLLVAVVATPAMVTLFFDRSTR